jgi:hypothetical protein
MASVILRLPRGRRQAAGQMIGRHLVDTVFEFDHLLAAIRFTKSDAQIGRIAVRG